ncbi:MAG: putative bifunctional diguanylate cyclase/phosphodiesterase [Pseudomonadota bacterium]
MQAPSVRTYTLLLLGLGVLTLTVLGWHMLDRLRAIELAEQQEAVAAARLEFEHAVDNTLAQSAGLAAQISGWDEVRQQLDSPVYYTYWRDNRATAQGLWPSYVRGLELYDARRELLSTFNARLPEIIPEGTVSALYVTSDGKLCLMHFAPVVDPSGEPHAISGYLGLRVDMLDAMRSLHRFVYVDPDSLRVKPSGSGAYPMDQAHEVIEYRIRQASWVSILPGLVRQTLFQFMLAFLILVALYYLLVTNLFSRPLRRLRDELERLRAGDAAASGVNEEALPVLELSEVRDALRDYRQSLEQAHDELDRTNAKLWTEAHIDALTGVYNRRAFDEDWARLLTNEEGGTLALLLLDCDFFKAINDSYGHDAGDRVLREIARLVSGELRREDRLYRLGGDEFLAILHGVSETQALHVAERCRIAVEAHPAESLGIHERLRISIGVAASEYLEREGSDLLRRVDVAMYQAKRGVGEGKVVPFRAELEDGMAGRSSHLVNAVLDAINDGSGIVMHYQPVVEASSGRVAYYEALVRILDDGGLIEPRDILSIAARRGLERRLDLAVLRAVLADLKAGEIPGGTGVSINFEGESIVDPEVAAQIELLARYAVDCKIVLEITETTLISRFELMNHALGRYRALGLRVALDDFGSGYSSLRYLARMQVDIVKLDRSLIDAYGDDEALRGMVEHVVAMLRDGGFEVVAEGIETEAQQRAFLKLGVGYLQGWRFGRPMRPIVKVSLSGG